MSGENYGQALEAVPSSNNSAMRRIESVSEDIEENC
jgi:tetrahydromethanopterin S-methyltransferase subunit F